MIRINLSGVPKAKSKKRGGGMAAMGGGSTGEGPNAVMLMVAGLVIGVLAGGYFYWSASKRAEQIATDTEKAEQDNKRLALVKTKFEEKEKQAAAYQRRVDVIDQLRNAQRGPADLLTMVGDTVSNTEAVWLNAMLDAGPAITMEGNALSQQAVANLIDNLDKTGHFQAIEIEESYQDNKMKDVTGFFFKIKCVKQQPKAQG